MFVSNEIRDEYVELYKDSYTKNRRERLPRKLISKEDTIYRLSALYSLAVQSRGCKFVHDDNTKSKVVHVTNWLHDSERRGLLLCGTLGNGKTTMMRAIETLVGYKAMMVVAKDVYDDFRSAEAPRYFQDRLLLIDDLGAEPERCNVFGVDYHPLSDVLLYRYRKNLTTIVATNLTMDELKSRYGDRVYDRILEMFIAIEYDAPSYRGRV